MHGWMVVLFQPSNSGCTRANWVICHQCSRPCHTNAPVMSVSASNSFSTALVDYLICLFFHPHQQIVHSRTDDVFNTVMQLLKTEREREHSAGLHHYAPAIHLRYMPLYKYVLIE